MQRHKRDSCTHSFWHRVFYTYCTSLWPLPSNILYRARYKTGLEFENIMRGSARVWIFNVVQLAGIVCNIFRRPSFLNPSRSFLFSSVGSPSISPAFVWSLCFLCCCRQSLFFCVSFCTDFPSFFLHVALCRTPPSQGFVTFLLQVTERSKGKAF